MCKRKLFPLYEPGTIDVNKMLTSLSMIIERWNEACLNQESSGQVRFKKSSFIVLLNSFENYFDPDHLQIRYGYNKCILVKGLF